jgi:hypothetical protein
MAECMDDHTGRFLGPNYNYSTSTVAEMQLGAVSAASLAAVINSSSGAGSGFANSPSPSPTAREGAAADARGGSNSNSNSIQGDGTNMLSIDHSSDHANAENSGVIAADSPNRQHRGGGRLHHDGSNEPNNDGVGLDNEANATWAADVGLHRPCFACLHAACGQNHQVADASSKCAECVTALHAATDDGFDASCQPCPFKAARAKFCGLARGGDGEEEGDAEQA